MGNLLSHLSGQLAFYMVYQVTFKKGRDPYYKAPEKVLSVPKTPILLPKLRGDRDIFMTYPPPQPSVLSGLTISIMTPSRMGWWVACPLTLDAE